MSRMKLLGFSRGSSLISMSVTQAPRRFPCHEGHVAPRGIRGSSAARVVVDREAERARGGAVVEVVARALESRGRGENAHHGGLVRRKLALVGLIAPHEALHGRQGGLIGGEPGAGERTVLPPRLA